MPDTSQVIRCITTHGQDTHYLRIVVSHIRQKIGDDPTQLKTEAGIGYRLMF
jgi:two-component system KDP operon response regulator KdpE